MIVNDNSPKAEFEFKDYFSAISHFYPNFTELLDIWSKSESKAGIKHIAGLIIDEQTNLFEGKKISGFRDQKDNAKEFIEWILSDKMLDKHQQKYFEFETESFAEKISWAEQLINTQRKSKAYDNV
ncbi:hypothetical protein LVD15_16515 [Fulvivirga maritima]|uniref:hypothetical protein n=1 Tax=Fulvivirga maritima TaxID=2904247 RepID=UPI001F422BA3|nr:hypothetical protein [Fulvivirga maritima]UII24903.1 hypothetical protein LVD15_16515 [Fulvivirga maritima]